MIDWTLEIRLKQHFFVKSMNIEKFIFFLMIFVAAVHFISCKHIIITRKSVCLLLNFFNIWTPPEISQILHKVNKLKLTKIKMYISFDNIRLIIL